MFGDTLFARKMVNLDFFDLPCEHECTDVTQSGMCALAFLRRLFFHQFRLSFAVLSYFLAVNTEIKYRKMVRQNNFLAI